MFCWILVLKVCSSVADNVNWQFLILRVSIHGTIFVFLLFFWIYPLITEFETFDKTCRQQTGHISKVQCVSKGHVLMATIRDFLVRQFPNNASRRVSISARFFFCNRIVQPGCTLFPNSILCKLNNLQLSEVICRFWSEFHNWPCFTSSNLFSIVQFARNSLIESFFKNSTVTC